MSNLVRPRNRILRGKFEAGQQPEHFCLDDGNFQHGWRVVRFEVRNIAPLIPTESATAVLGISELVRREWEFDDDRGYQIAWASCGSANTGQGGSVVTTSLCDFSAIVHVDLYLAGDMSGDDSSFNYFIELEPVSMTKNEGLYVAAKNYSIDQND